MPARQVGSTGKLPANGCHVAPKSSLVTIRAFGDKKNIALRSANSAYNRPDCPGPTSSWRTAQPLLAMVGAGKLGATLGRRVDVGKIGKVGGTRVGVVLGGGNVAVDVGAIVGVNVGTGVGVLAHAASKNIIAALASQRITTAANPSRPLPRQSARRTRCQQKLLDRWDCRARSRCRRLRHRD